MRTSKITLLAATTLIGLLTTTGCSDNYEYNLAGEGSVRFSATFSSDVKVASRAASEAELAESAILWISSTNGNAKDGVVRKFKDLSTLPAEGIKLAGGSYVAEVWAGDSVPAAFDKKYYKGRTPFTVTSGATQVEIVGRIANSVVSVELDPTVADVLTDVKVTVGHARGSLTYQDETLASKGYFMMPSSDKDLAWTLSGKKVSDGTMYSRTGTIADAQSTTEYILKVKYTAVPDQVGGGWLDIVIDQTEIAVEDDILICLPPKIQGYGFDIAAPVYGSEHAVGRKSVFISAAAAMTSVIVESNLLTPVVGGIDADLLYDNASMQSSLNTAGINWVYNYDAAQDLSTIKINLETEFLNALTNGEYAIKFIVTDANNKTSEATLNVIVSDAMVVTNPVDMEDTANSATSLKLIGTLADDDATDPGFEYRKLGDTDWTEVLANQSRAKGDVYSVVVTGLKPGTTYEYRAICTIPTGRFTGGIVKATTEEALQIPNCGFEGWQTSSSPYLLYASGAEQYWDSGNHGSSTMRMNVTTPESSIKHSGSYSAKLASQFVGIRTLGRFAAGNAFVGQYLTTEGTDGILGFGKPFTGRPKSLRVWVKYDPVAIEELDKTVGSNTPDEYKVGDMDRGIIYFALLDDTLESTEYKGTTYSAPCIIRTKEFKFFNKNGNNVIAYGEKVFTSTPEMTMFEIPFEYYREGVRPTYLLLTCSASKGGDYFVGGKGSTMYIDDIELIYE